MSNYWQRSGSHLAQMLCDTLLICCCVISSYALIHGLVLSTLSWPSTDAMSILRIWLTTPISTMAHLLLLLSTVGQRLPYIETLWLALLFYTSLIGLKLAVSSIQSERNDGFIRNQERLCAQGLPDLHSSIDMIFLPPAAYSFFKFYICVGCHNL